MGDSFEYWLEFSKTLKTEDYHNSGFVIRHIDQFGDDGDIVERLALTKSTGNEIIHDYTGNLHSIFSTAIFVVENGFVHSENTPARYSETHITFYENGLIHRRNGPAIIYCNEMMEWHFHGEMYDLQEFLSMSDLTDEEKLELVLKYG